MSIPVTIRYHKRDAGGIAHENDLQGTIPSNRAENRLLPEVPGLTQEELAEQVGVTPAFIGHLEAPNISKALSLDTLFDIASVLEVSPHKFLCFEDP